MRDSAGSFGRALGRLLVFDVQGALPALLIWWWTGLAELGVILLLLVVVRPGLWIAFLWRLMEPVRGWGARSLDSCADVELLELDAKLQALPRRFAARYVLAWALTQAALVSSGLLGWPSADTHYAGSELLAALSLSCATTLPNLFIYRSTTARALAEPLHEVSAALVARRRVPSREPQRSERRGGSFNAALFVAYTTILAPFLILHDAELEREAARARAQAQVLRAQLALAEGRALPEQVELLSSRALADAELREALAPAPEPVASAEVKIEQAALPRRARAYARAQLDDGAVLLAAVEIDERAGELAFGLVVLLLIAGGTAWEAGRDMQRETLAPVEQFNEATRRFSEGGELSELARIVPVRRDEIGQLAEHFNTMLDILEELSLAADAVAQGRLEVSFARPGQLHASFRSMVERLAETVGQLRLVSHELAAVSHQLEALTAQQERSAREQLRAVDRVDGSVQALHRAGELVSERAGTVVEEAAQSLIGTREITAKIQELLEASAGIELLLGRVGEVAERSDLLALNGALEAVRAGEVGRGFALVAAEMRRLAEGAARTLDDAHARVAEIERVGASTVAVAERGRALAEGAMAAAEEISAGASERSREAAAIVEGMGEVSKIVADGAELTAQTRETAASLGSRARALEQLLAGFEGDAGPRAGRATKGS